MLAVLLLRALTLTLLPWRGRRRGRKGLDVDGIDVDEARNDNGDDGTWEGKQLLLLLLAAVPSPRRGRIR